MVVGVMLYRDSCAGFYRRTNAFLMGMWRRIILQLALIDGWLSGGLHCLLNIVNCRVSLITRHHMIVTGLRTFATILSLETIGNLILLFSTLFAVAQRGNMNAGLVGLALSYAMSVTQVHINSCIKLDPSCFLEQIALRHFIPRLTCQSSLSAHFDFACSRL
jgi:hypothetical protein